MSESSTALPTQSANPSLLRIAHIPIPRQLKFLMNSIKTIVTTQLTTENHPIWKSQVLKLFTANGFDGYLDGSISCPPMYTDTTLAQLNYDHSLWLLIDQNLAAALSSTISSSLLPYVLNLPTCKDIWHTIEIRLQSTNRSRIIQLKTELQNFSMGTLTMTQFLTGIKSKVDAIAAAGVHLDPEDVIHYTLNGLPSSFQIFKTTIRTIRQPLTLDEFYALLCSEECNIAADTQRELQQASLPSNSATALYTGSSRGRGRHFSHRGRNSSHNNRSNASQPKGQLITCQICNKTGHSASKCWHRGNFSY